MTDPGSLPPSVLVKIATLEQRCIGLSEKLEHARRALQALRIERRDCVPKTVYDEAGVNEESERVLAEWARLDAAAETQVARCEALEKRLATEEGVVRSCKVYLRELPADARLRTVDGYAGDVNVVRQRIREVQDEIGRVGRLPVPSADLPERIARHIAKLAARAEPMITGIGNGQDLNVLWPLHDRADRNTQTGFVPHEANALLLAAFLDGERLAERLLRVALEGSFLATERSARLHTLQQQLFALRFDEEASVCAALDRGEDVSRSGSTLAWAVLMVSVEHEQQAAA